MVALASQPGCARTSAQAFAHLCRSGEWRIETGELRTGGRGPVPEAEYDTHHADDLAQGVPETAIGEAGVASLFEDGDGGRLVETAQAGGRRHAASDGANDDL